MHLHSINASVSWFSPVAPYAKFQKSKGSGDPILQRNRDKKQRHCGLQSVRAGSVCLPLTARALLHNQLPPWPPKGSFSLLPSSHPGSKGALCPRRPNAQPQRAWRAAVETCGLLVLGKWGPGKVLLPGQGAGRPPCYRLPGRCSWGVAGTNTDTVTGLTLSSLCFCLPDRCSSPSRSHQHLSWPRSGPRPGRDRPHSFCKRLAGKPAFLPWPLAHTHALYLQREGLGRLFLHRVSEYPQQHFVLPFLIQALADKAQGSRSGSTRPRGNNSCQSQACHLHPTPVAPAQSGAGCGGADSPPCVLLRGPGVLGQNARSTS